MSSSMKWLVFTGLAICAALSYGVGLSEGVWFFIYLGAVFELSFWLGLLTCADE